MKVKDDHRSKFSNLSNWKEEAWKIQGFNGIIVYNTGLSEKCSAFLFGLYFTWKWQMV